MNILITGVHGFVGSFGLGRGSHNTIYGLDIVADKMEHFICLDNEQRKSMGLAGRDKVEKDLDRRIVVNKYLTAVEEAIKK